MRCKRYKFDTKKGFQQNGTIHNEVHEWNPDLIPEFMDARLYRSSHISVSEKFYTKHFPCCYTLRFIINGQAVFRIKNMEWELEPGDVFVVFSGVPIELGNISDHKPLEWYELQFIGAASYHLLNAIGLTSKNPVSKPKNREIIHSQFQKLHDYFGKPDRRYLKALSLLMDLMNSLAPKNELQGGSSGNPEEQLVRDVKNLLQSSSHALGKNIEELAEQYFHVDRTTLFRAFRKVEGVSPKHFVLELRLKRAKELLQTSDSSLTDIAKASGFQSSKYFINFFHKKTGFSPENWRKMIQNPKR